MKTNDLAFSLSFSQTPEEVFNAINNVRGWWSETLEGETQQQGDEFVYRYRDFHASRQRVVEMIPNKKVVWLVTESELSFLENTAEWAGTHIIFEISRKGKETKLQFTHQGLNPGSECYKACFGGWSYFLNQSLLSLVTTGKGRPNDMEVRTSAAE